MAISLPNIAAAASTITSSKSTKLGLDAWLRIPSYAFGKSIQRSYSFMASFIDNPLNTAGNRRATGPMPIINPYHIISVGLPTYNFQKEAMIMGTVPVTFPVFNVENASNMSFDVTFEEDEFATIEFFISWLQRQIIDNDGYYIPPLQNRIGHFIVEIQDNAGIPVLFYTFKDIYYLSTTPVTYDYGSNDSIKRTVTFGVDRIETLFTKYTAINLVQKGIQTIGAAVGAGNIINNVLSII